jgi:hypothetical protein
MFTALIVTAVLHCKPYRPPHPPPPVVHVRCEGSDQVRRDDFGNELSRWSFAPQCRPAPVRLTTDPRPIRFGLSSRG